MSRVVDNVLGALLGTSLFIGVVGGSELLGCRQGSRAARQDPPSCAELGRAAYDECLAGGVHGPATHEQCERWATDLATICEVERSERP